MAVAQLFRALGDPIRLEMVSRLSSGSSYTITIVSQELGISRQGARKHLQILADAHLVSFQEKGRETLVELKKDELMRAKEFIAKLEKQWDVRLEKLKNFVES